ncbi:hypothetical protein ACJMK2_029985 [Sinanodonta woodiana]|uniref:protein-serine/threonine phosphatase n=1 Tax=Sinanodonta woodiana TaxID=1069815 RepID=A0ABD3XDY2_SINWO
MDLNMFSQIAHITEHLFLSSAGAVKSDRVKNLGITNVINCTLEIPNIECQGVETLQIFVEDAPHARLEMYFDRCADKIHQVSQKGGRTLVHCMAGVSRSATLCIAYMMKYKRMSLKQAYDYIKKRRPVIRPNTGFWRQLIEFERRLFGSTSVKMVSSSIGPIPDVYKEETRNMDYLDSKEDLD